MTPDRLNKSLLILLVILTGLSLYLMFNGNRNIREARKEISTIKSDLELAKNRINESQEILDSVFVRMETTKKQLEIIGSERKNLEDNISNMLLRNHRQYQNLNTEMNELSQKNDSLRKEVAKWQR